MVDGPPPEPKTGKIKMRQQLFGILNFDTNHDEALADFVNGGTGLHQSLEDARLAVEEAALEFTDQLSDAGFDLPEMGQLKWNESGDQAVLSYNSDKRRLKWEIHVFGVEPKRSGE